MGTITLINDLIDQHGDTFMDCAGCELCGKVEQLRANIDREPEIKFQRILAKGQDMTRADILFLLDNDVKQKEIQQALGICKQTIGKLFKSWKIPARNPGGGMKKGQVRVKFTKEDYSILKSQGLSDEKIAVELGVSRSTMFYQKKKWATQIG